MRARAGLARGGEHGPSYDVIGSVALGAARGGEAVHRAADEKSPRSLTPGEGDREPPFRQMDAVEPCGERDVEAVVEDDSGPANGAAHAPSEFKKLSGRGRFFTYLDHRGAAAGGGRAGAREIRALRAVGDDHEMEGAAFKRHAREGRGRGSTPRRVRAEECVPRARRVARPRRRD